MNYDAAFTLADLEADTAYHAVKACIAAQALQRCGVPASLRPDLGVVRRALERLEGEKA